MGMGTTCRDSSQRSMSGRAVDLPQGAGYPFFRTPEPDSGRSRLQCLRRRALRSVPCADGGSKSGERPLFSAHGGRVLQGHGFQAGDCVANSRLGESLGVSTSGAAGVATPPLHDLSDAPAPERRDASRALSLPVAGAQRRGFGPRQDGGHRRDDAGGERDGAENRPPQHGRGLHNLADAVGRSVGVCDADSRVPARTHLRRRAPLPILTPVNSPHMANSDPSSHRDGVAMHKTNG